MALGWTSGALLLTTITTTAPPPAPGRHSTGPNPRLGRVEAAILDALQRSGGLIQRDEARDHAFPRLRVRDTHPRGRTAAMREQQARARAEAAVSRAIVSLVRKKLVVREHNPRTGRTLLLSPERVQLPDWEEMARAEEDLAAHAMGVADSWTALARRAQKRAAALRTDRAVEGTEAERRADLAEIDRMQAEAG